MFENSFTARSQKFVAKLSKNESDDDIDRQTVYPEPDANDLPLLETEIIAAKQTSVVKKNEVQVGGEGEVEVSSEGESTSRKGSSR